MPEAVLVDGYNVLHAIPRFAPRGGDLAEAREGFERWLAQAAARKRVAESVIVWDGRRGSRSATRRSRRLIVLYTDPSTTADDRILDLCRGPYAKRADVTWVVSSDRDVQGPARQLGFTAIGAMTFYRRWSSSGSDPGRSPETTRRRRGSRSSGAEANPRSNRSEVDELLGELLSRREDFEGGES
ncbi:MAG: NYN domain-containing protein [Gemmatimonadota bacterium]